MVVCLFYFYFVCFIILYFDCCLCRRGASRMASLTHTPTEAQTPAVAAEVPMGLTAPAKSTNDYSHANIGALPDYPFYNVRHQPVSEVTAEFYLQRLNENFVMRNGANRYQWMNTNMHFLLKDHSQKGRDAWIYKRNKNVVNARNTMLELHDVSYSVEEWLAKDFGSFNYVETDTPPSEKV